MEDPVIDASRYYFWRAGSVMYLGRGGVSSLHRHHFIQLCVAARDVLKVRSASDAAYVRHDGVVIDADAPHQLVAAGRRPILMLWVDPESSFGAQIRLRYRPGPGVQPLSGEDRDGLFGLVADLKEAPDCTGARLLLTEVEIAFGLPRTPPERDDRIERLLERLRTAPTAATPNVEDLAALVHLSPSRLMHLFQSEIGLPIRRYVLWQRLLRSLEIMSGGHSMTEAAHEAGFSDSPHLTRTFRDMLGARPSDLFRNSRFVQALPCLDS